MVALLSQCFSDDVNRSKQNNDNDSKDLSILKSDEQRNLDPDSTFPPQKQYDDIPKPRDSRLLKKDDSVLNNQLSDISEYVEYLEKLVVDYKKYIEERFKNVNEQKYKVIENFSSGMGGKNMNDLLVYIITCVFVLLLVDYIFKMGKSSY
jgi:hypothetical protein